MPKKLTTQDFIDRSKKTHGEKYNYGKMKYVNTATKVTITCSIHGDFEQQPSSHMAGVGCPSCARVKPLTKKEFVKKASY